MTRNPVMEGVVDQVAALLNNRIGLRPEPTLRGRLLRCIRDEAAAYGQDAQTYLDTLASHEDALQSLLNQVTVQETAFFRHSDHFDVLAREVLPRLSAPVTIWSAGCANGQEAYSIAMVLEEEGIDGTVIATDLSTDALQRTAEARYATRELSGLSPARRARHLVGSGSSGWLINDAVRRRVTILRHNLIDPLPDQVLTSQVIFCRNVLIYFSAEHMRTFLDRAADLPACGYLFLGSAETMWSTSNRFETMRIGETYLYRRRPAALRGLPGLRTSPALPLRDAGMPRLADPVGASNASPEQSSRDGRRRPRRPGADAVRHAPPAEPDATAAQVLARAGQVALDAGEIQPAVVAFRKWVYVAPHDAVAHLHLGLALEAAGDQPAAQRAFRAARVAASDCDQALVAHAMEGYAPDELLRLLDAKLGTATP